MWILTNLHSFGSKSLVSYLTTPLKSSACRILGEEWSLLLKIQFQQLRKEVWKILDLYSLSMI